MLTAEGCAARRERLWGALPSGCDVLIVGDPSHLTYFAGYVPSPFVFRTVESGALLMLEPGRATLVADDMLGPLPRSGARRRACRADLVRRQAFGPVPPGPARRIGARPAGEDPGPADRRRAGVRAGGGGRGAARGAAGARGRRHRPADPADAAVEGPRRGRDPAAVDARRRGGPGGGPGGGRARA